MLHSMGQMSRLQGESGPKALVCSEGGSIVCVADMMEGVCMSSRRFTSSC